MNRREERRSNEQQSRVDKKTNGIRAWQVGQPRTESPRTTQINQGTALERARSATATFLNLPWF